MPEGTQALIDERQKKYGDPVAGHIRIAQVWSAILGHEVQPVQVPLMMAGLKLVRADASPEYEDNYADIEGYVHIARLIAGIAGKVGMRTFTNACPECGKDKTVEWPWENKTVRVFFICSNMDCRHHWEEEFSA